MASPRVKAHLGEALKERSLPPFPRRSLVYARCDGFRVDAHPFLLYSSTRAGSLDILLFFVFSNFLVSASGFLRFFVSLLLFF
jgi:hypothetical protein